VIYLKSLVLLALSGASSFSTLTHRVQQLLVFFLHVDQIWWLELSCHGMFCQRWSREVTSEHWDISFTVTYLGFAWYVTCKELPSLPYYWVSPISICIASLIPPYKGVEQCRCRCPTEGLKLASHFDRMARAIGKLRLGLQRLLDVRLIPYPLRTNAIRYLLFVGTSILGLSEWTRSRQWDDWWIKVFTQTNPP
jgi:hypothetical protein